MRHWCAWEGRPRGGHASDHLHRLHRLCCRSGCRLIHHFHLNGRAHIHSLRLRRIDHHSQSPAWLFVSRKCLRPRCHMESYSIRI